MRPPDNLAPGICDWPLPPAAPPRPLPPASRRSDRRQAGGVRAAAKRRRAHCQRPAVGFQQRLQEGNYGEVRGVCQQKHVARSGDNPNLARRNSWPHAAKPPGHTTGAKPSMRGPTFALLPIRPIVSYHVKMRQFNLFGINLGTFAADL
ncbi:hypothetical protein CISG_09424 [Coccidioides immitis RMSCC 3703]|uniref:Uncharacterized protein n=1 Tax=Coccidioides immitis RMSCC 3703 TaxID=454286 RepID=A0A0J8RDJ1_COCIT|nr:hypothetical protein CISG_09424 [Coccidioides immitis RMSCC 3703]